jgi:cysteine sulfinate desulfinase/cysteine desulfurase-like protein
MGFDHDRAVGAMRLSLGHGTQADDVRRAVYILARATTAADTAAAHYAIY